MNGVEKQFIGQQTIHQLLDKFNQCILLFCYCLFTFRATLFGLFGVEERVNSTTSGLLERLSYCSRRMISDFLTLASLCQI